MSKENKKIADATENAENEVLETEGDKAEVESTETAEAETEAVETAEAEAVEAETEAETEDGDEPKVSAVVEARRKARAEKKLASTQKAANKKPGLFSRLGKLFKETRAEAKKVTWASKRSTFKNFMLVLVVVLAMAGVIGLLDWLLGSLFDILLHNINV